MTAALAPLPRRRAITVMTGIGAIVASLPATAAPKPAPAPKRPASIVARDGTRLYHRDWGEGRPVVFLAGWGLPSECWAYQAAALSEEGLRCVSYDRRGHGRSDAPWKGYDYDTLADDLAAVLEQLDLRDVVLVGHSMAGGEIVRYFSRHGGARVGKVLFLAPLDPCPAHKADNPTGLPPETFEQFRAQVLMRDYPRWLEENARPFVTPDTSAEMVDWVRGLMLGTTTKALVECNRAATTADLRPEIPNVTVPALVIQGDKDASTPLETSGRRYAALAPNAELVVYQGAPHGLMFTHIERLNGDIIRFARS
ncbi:MULTISPECIES: alpha/beta fold hydrolase [unclassified Caulobacter]|uniref:alpha/beta fold hydrolase n=1 Tax=unclassified Caulobacter TaxID=2648921 RepID=UPI000AD68365|nr:MULTISPECIES: alpha/beta hydrolase [unclassified Caulobacter]